MMGQRRDSQSQAQGSPKHSVEGVSHATDTCKMFRVSGAFQIEMCDSRGIKPLITLIPLGTDALKAHAPQAWLSTQNSLVWWKSTDCWCKVLIHFAVLFIKRFTFSFIKGNFVMGPIVSKMPTKQFLDHRAESSHRGPRQPQPGAISLPDLISSLRCREHLQIGFSFFTLSPLSICTHSCLMLIHVSKLWYYSSNSSLGCVNPTETMRPWDCGWNCHWNCKVAWLLIPSETQNSCLPRHGHKSQECWQWNTPNLNHSCWSLSLRGLCVFWYLCAMAPLCSSKLGRYSEFVFTNSFTHEITMAELWGGVQVK